MVVVGGVVDFFLEFVFVLVIIILVFVTRFRWRFCSEKLGIVIIQLIVISWILMELAGA